MKKFLAVVVVALAVAATVWLVVRVQLANRLAAVPELLPVDTLLLVHLQDLQRSRERWHQSDLYQLWREPSVQASLQKPLRRLPQKGRGRQALEEFFRLGPTHGFVALTSLEKNEPKLIGGFHFAQSPEKAREFINQCQADWWPESEAKRATIVYEQHQIETITISRLVLATVSHNHWFFASNDVAALKALLDRADHRRENAGASLQESKTFAEATHHLPGDYAGMIFVDPRPFVEKLMPLVAMTGQSLPLQQMERLKEVQSIAAAFGFDQGEMRETDFAAMPRLGKEKKLVRPLFAAAGADTVFYSVSRVHWSDGIFSSSNTGVTGMPALFKQFGTAMTERGISSDDLRLAFGEELEVAANWPVEAHWPTLLMTLPVNEGARARKIAEALTSTEIAGTPWTRTEENGAVVYSAQPFGGFIPITPAIAIADKLMFASSDLAALTAAMTTVGKPAHELEKSAIFREAASRVPVAETAFNYLDTRLLIEPADGALRPLLLMGAAFYPALAKNVDVAKFPPREAIAKHLSPIVMSQRYEDNGYVTESIGPVTFREATIGVAGAIGALFLNLGGPEAYLSGTSALPVPAPTAPLTPSPSPF